jgi:phosphoglycerol transferase MdoB-like AlkP superfamily enzyme
VRSKPWYRNTLFIIVADHSHNSYRNWHPESREYHRIPLLFYGDVIRQEFRGKKWMKTGNQHDIPATLLAQMGIPSSNFKYSKNLFNPYSGDFAYYSTEDGAGWLNKGNYYTFETHPPLRYWWSYFVNPADSMIYIDQARAYLQTVFGEYMKN